MLINANHRKFQYSIISFLFWLISFFLFEVIKMRREERMNAFIFDVISDSRERFFPVVRANRMYAPATRILEWFPVVKSEDTVHSDADGRSIVPYSKKMEYRWVGLSLLLGAGAVSLLLLRIPFPRSVVTPANTILIFMPRVEDEDKNKDDEQSNRTNEGDRRSSHKVMAIISTMFSIFFK